MLLPSKRICESCTKNCTLQHDNSSRLPELTVDLSAGGTIRRSRKCKMIRSTYVDDAKRSSSRPSARRNPPGTDHDTSQAPNELEANALADGGGRKAHTCAMLLCSIQPNAVRAAPVKTCTQHRRMTYLMRT